MLAIFGAMQKSSHVHIYADPGTSSLVDAAKCSRSIGICRSRCNSVLLHSHELWKSEVEAERQLILYHIATDVCGVSQLDIVWDDA